MTFLLVTISTTQSDFRRQSHFTTQTTQTTTFGSNSESLFPSLPAPNAESQLILLFFFSFGTGRSVAGPTGPRRLAGPAEAPSELQTPEHHDGWLQRAQLPIVQVTRVVVVLFFPRTVAGRQGRGAGVLAADADHPQTIDHRGDPDRQRIPETSACSGRVRSADVSRDFLIHVFRGRGQTCWGSRSVKRAVIRQIIKCYSLVSNDETTTKFFYDELTNISN